jgi:spore coat protein H
MRMRRYNLMLLLVLGMGCGSQTVPPADMVATDLPLEDLSTDDHRPEGWTRATHSNDGEADYDVVFPQDAVLEITIVVSPENWQAMLEDMEEMYGEFGKSGEQQQPVPDEAVAACEELAQTEECTFQLDGKTIAGTCEELWDGLVACKGSPPQSTDDCTGKSADDSCTFSGGGGGLPGICLMADQLVCIPAKDIETCAASQAGDACSIGPPDNPMPGTCVDLAGTLACIPNNLLPTAGPGGGPPPGGEIDRNPIWVPVTVHANGLTWWHVGMRFKGNSTLKFTWQQGSYKLPFKFDFDQFEDDYPAIDNQRFYGFKKLAFANNQRDNSLLREKLAGEFFRSAGVPTPQRAFVAVTLDHGSGATYMGLYTMAEVPDDPLFEAAFGNNDGNLYKPDGVSARWLADAVYDENSFSKKSNEEAADWSDVEAAVAALNADPSDAPAWREELELHLDVQGFLTYLAANTVMQDWDQYGNIPHNYYLYGDLSDGGRIHWIPWDHNESLKESGGMMPPLPLDMSSVGPDWPLIRRLLDDPVYLAQYQSHVADFVTGPFLQETALARVTQAHALIAPYVTGDTGEAEPFTVLSSPEAFDAERDQLLSHIAGRHTAVAAYLNQ